MKTPLSDELYKSFKNGTIGYNELYAIHRLEESHARLLEACGAVAGVFQDSDDMPLYARRCIAAIKEAQEASC